MIHVSFSLLKLLLGVVFGAVCGYVSGLFITRSRFAESLIIEDNEEDMTFYSNAQMDNYGNDFYNFTEKRRKKQASEKIRYIAMTAMAFLTFVIVLVFLIVKGGGFGGNRKALVELGQGESATAENPIVTIVIKPITKDAEGRVVIPYEITNKTNKPLKTASVVGAVNGVEITCSKEKESEPGSNKLVSFDEPVVGWESASYYVVLDSTEMRKAGLKKINNVSLTFATYTEDFENGNAKENETYLTITEDIVNQ